MRDRTLFVVLGMVGLWACGGELGEPGVVQVPDASADVSGPGPMGPNDPRPHGDPAPGSEPSATSGDGPDASDGGLQASGDGGGADLLPMGDAGLPTDAATGKPDAASPPTPTVDRLSTDRQHFWGDSRCGALDVLFCDGFEAPNIGAHWQKQGNGNATIDTAQAARGGRSLHVHTEGNGFAFLRLSSLFPVANDRYYGRMFVRFDALPSAPTWAHWTIAEARGAGDGSLIRVGGQLDRSHNRFGIGSDGGPTGDWTWLDDDPMGMGQTVPEDEWLCIEWLHDGAADATRFYWDAMEHASLATTADQHGGAAVPYVMPQFESVWVGFWLYQGGATPSAYDVWIDEVAFDDERIGCVD